MRKPKKTTTKIVLCPRQSPNGTYERFPLKDRELLKLARVTAIRRPLMPTVICGAGVSFSFFKSPLDEAMHTGTFRKPSIGLLGFPFLCPTNDTYIKLEKASTPVLMSNANFASEKVIQVVSGEQFVAALTDSGFVIEIGVPLDDSVHLTAFGECWVQVVLLYIFVVFRLQQTKKIRTRQR